MRLRMSLIARGYAWGLVDGGPHPHKMGVMLPAVHVGVSVQGLQGAGAMGAYLAWPRGPFLMLLMPWKAQRTSFPRKVWDMGKGTPARRTTNESSGL